MIIIRSPDTQERGTFEPLLFFWREENWKIVGRFRQYVKVRLPLGMWLFQFLQDIGRQVAVLGREKVHLRFFHLGADWSGFCHFEGDDKVFRDRQENFVLLYFRSCVDPSIIWWIVSHLDLVKYSATIFEPLDKLVEYHEFRVIYRNLMRRREPLGSTWSSA